MNKLSFVISTYARENSTKCLVESIRKRVPETAREIIFVSSDDPSCSKSQWLLSQTDVKVIFADIRRDKRLNSLYYYENLGIKASSHDWIFVTNDDTILQEGFYENFLRVANDHDVILVNGHIGDVSLGARIPVVGTLTNPQGIKRELYLYDFSLIRKEVYEKIGFLDEKLDWFGKGVDLALTCEVQENIKILHQSDIYVDHIISYENRNPPRCESDFSYIDKKWQLWCKKSGWIYSWPWQC